MGRNKKSRKQKTPKPSQPSAAPMSTGGPSALNAGGFVCFINETRFVLPEYIEGVGRASQAGIPSFGPQFLKDNEHHDTQTMTPAVLKEAYRVYISLRFPDDTVEDRDAALARGESDTAKIFFFRHEQNLKKLRGVTAVGSLVAMSPVRELESPPNELSFDEQERRTETGDLPDPNQREISPLTIAPSACSTYSYVLRNDQLTTVVTKAKSDISSSEFGDSSVMGTSNSKDIARTQADEANAASRFDVGTAGGLPYIEADSDDSLYSTDKIPKKPSATIQPRGNATTPCTFEAQSRGVNSPFAYEPNVSTETRSAAKEPTEVDKNLAKHQPNFTAARKSSTYEPSVSRETRPTITAPGIMEPTTAGPHASAESSQVDNAGTSHNDTSGDGSFYNYYGEGRDASTSAYGQDRDVFSALEDILSAQLAQLGDDDEA